MEKVEGPSTVKIYYLILNIKALLKRKRVYLNKVSFHKTPVLCDL